MTESQRLSIASTAGTSFFTARASPLDTPTDPDPFPRQDLVKITTDGLDSNPVLHKTVMHVVSTDVAVIQPFLPPLTPVGPPPPSPPASIKQGDDPDLARLAFMRPPKSDPRPIAFENLERARDRTPSVDSRDTPRVLPRSPPSAFPKPPLPPPHHDLLHRASTDTRLSSLSARTGASSSTRAPRTLALSDGISEVLVAEPSVYVSASPPPSAKYKRNHASSLSQSQSPDGLLQPPHNGSGSGSSSHHPARRNTTGGHIRPVRSAPQAGYGYDVDADIEDDIQLQAEQIRRERKRAKAHKDAQEAFTRSSSRRRGSIGKEDDNKVLVGNLIGEDHVNYVLMYNMLTGIRIAVRVAIVCHACRSPRSLARCRGARQRLNDHLLTKTLLRDTSIPLTCTHSLVLSSPHFPYPLHSIGNELTPSAKYDFKFKDYAPWVFRELREDYFQLDPADYLLSLTAKYILSELGSPGKSGSFFYFSRDYRFIIKTIHHSEHKFLFSILEKYYTHVKNNPHTLLSRFYGLHRVKLPRGRKIHFVIMNNLFPPHKDVHETYDLKGSTVGRVYPEETAEKNPRAVLKDLNWINRGKTLELGPEKRALLTEQLRRDSEFLKTVHVMDYSLLVGIHHVRRGNRDKVRSNTLKVFSVSGGGVVSQCCADQFRQPSVPAIRRKNAQHKGARSPEAIAMKRAMRQSDPKRLGSDTLDLPEKDTGDRQQFLFYQDEGGLQATDEANQALDDLYYLGIIDILTPYSAVKQLEHFWKGLKADRVSASLRDRGIPLFTCLFIA